MTKEQLEMAQSLHSMYERATRHAEELDPKRERTNDMARHFDAILVHASRGFMQLTGKHPSRVSFTELNTENPAPWTKNVKRLP